ncbi:hypothetical protein N657DRAFT_685380 [Parathielavia appendiculata]|uniref:Uncharacterized protein n=1 Tax=Parathielavia appendiculata TaxID=2587402 RepID=A0AAN6TQB6_9PEZI|nr:hypothetical protein N657DRAFT_685380 [Parathielavia appendiculata]
MPLPLRATILWLYALFTVTKAVLLHSDPRCEPGEYWCQDRCGSDEYDDTCCPTPDGQHHLCGSGTTCCMYGCCPAGTVCNAVGGCDSVPGPNTSRPGSTLISTLTSQIVVTQIRTRTKTVTLTSFKPCPSDVTHATSTTSASTWVNSKGETFVSSHSAIIIGGTKTVPVPMEDTTVTTDGYTFTFGTPSTSGSQPGDDVSPTTWTRSDGQTVISSSGIIQIGTSPPITLPTVSSLTTLTTGGETFTLSPAPMGSTGGSTGAGGGATMWTRSDGQTVISSSGIVQIGTNAPITLPSVSSLTTITTGGETFTLSPITTTAQTQASGVTTWTRSDGQTVISSSGVIQIGTSPPITLPSVSSLTTLTTDGKTFTLSPSTQSQGSATTWTRSDGQTVVSNSGIIQIGTNAPITFPSVSSLTTVTTGGETFTLSPTAVPSQSQASVTTWTRSDGQTVISSSGVVQIGTKPPFTLPSVSSLTTLITDGETFTLSPAPTTTPTQSQAGATTWTLSNGETVVSSSGIVQIGTNAPITLPTVTAPTTISTGGGVFTLFPPTSTFSTTARGATGIFTTMLPNGETMVSSGSVVQIGTGSPITLSGTTTVTTGGGIFTWTAPGAITTSSSTTSVVGGPLPTFSGFPGGLFLFPLRGDKVDDPEDPDDDGDDKKTGKKCFMLWFFPVCIEIPEFNIEIEAWNFNLPPGIFPPGPPPLPKISLPPGIGFKGSLPSWPAITVGHNGQPTYSSKPTNCKTETAEVCVETQSVVPSTTQFISTCIPVLGCHATDEATTTTTSCSAATVTSFAVSCAAGFPSSCTTLTSVISSGCSASGTASTTVGSCTLLRTSTVSITELIPACDVLSTSTVSITEIEPAPETTTTNGTSIASWPTTDGNPNATVSTPTTRSLRTTYITTYITITSTPGATFAR